MRLRFCVLLLMLSHLGWADTPAPALTPRQEYDRALELFSQGHAFTAEEQKGLTDLRARLVDSGDSDLAADLDLLRLGSAAQTTALDLRNQDATSGEQDSDQWDERQRFARDRNFWRTVRDVGLTTFTTSAVLTLLLASVNDRDEGYLHNGSYSDWSNKHAVANGLNWALVGSASTMFLSLFPLVWGEARQ